MPFYQRNHADHLIEVFSNRGSPLRLVKITDEFEKVLRKYDRNIPREIGKTVSRTLQNHCKECAGWQGYDLFYMPEGKGEGLWAVRQEEVYAYLEERDSGLRGGRVWIDPVYREALTIAKDIVKKALREKGFKLANVDTDSIERLTKGVIANNPDILKEAKRRVDQRSELGIGHLDLSCNDGVMSRMSPSG